MTKSIHCLCQTQSRTQKSIEGHKTTRHDADHTSNTESTLNTFQR